jgi:hypothetical protein
MILSESPAPITDNIFFLASPETFSTDTGKKWAIALTDHFSKFLEMRSLELKPHGLLFVSVLVNNEPELKAFQAKELSLYSAIAQDLLP